MQADRRPEGWTEQEVVRARSEAVLCTVGGADGVWGENSGSVRSPLSCQAPVDDGRSHARTHPRACTATAELRGQAPEAPGNQVIKQGPDERPPTKSQAEPAEQRARPSPGGRARERI